MLAFAPPRKASAVECEYPLGGDSREEAFQRKQLQWDEHFEDSLKHVNYMWCISRLQLVKTNNLVNYKTEAKLVILKIPDLL